MNSNNLKHLARELLVYAEQMYLERCVAISVLQATKDPAAMVTFGAGLSSARDRIHQQFLPLYERLEAAIADRELEDAIRTILQKLPKGPVN